MKTNYRQLSRITDLNNLKTAWKKVYKKDSSAGQDRQSVQDFAEHLEKELKSLRQELIEEVYHGRKELKCSTIPCSDGTITMVSWSRLKK